MCHSHQVCGESGDQIKFYSGQLAARAKDIKDPERLVNITMDIEKEQFTENVGPGITNYVVDGKVIATGAELYEVADRSLINELIRAMESVDQLTEEQRKNL